MTNKKLSAKNKRSADKAADIQKELDDKLDRLGRLIAAAATSSQYLDLLNDLDMRHLMRSAVAYTAVADKLYSTSPMNAETKAGMCFMLGYVIGKNTVSPQDQEKQNESSV